CKFFPHLECKGRAEHVLSTETLPALPCPFPRAKVSRWRIARARPCTSVRPASSQSLRGRDRALSRPEEDRKPFRSLFSTCRLIAVPSRARSSDANRYQSTPL